MDIFIFKGENVVNWILFKTECTRAETYWGHVYRRHI